MGPRFSFLVLALLGVAGQELFGTLLPRALDHLAGRALFHDDAAVHEDDLVGYVAGKGHFVGDNDHGGLLFGQGADHLQHLAGQLGVQGAGGLVKAEDIRVEGQRPGDSHPLLLAESWWG